jgi:hypothetical protein
MRLRGPTPEEEKNMTDEPKKTDEPAVVQVIAGPYAGQRLTMSMADADAAIADKWAIDPNAPAPTEEPKAMTDDERAQIAEKAEKAARKLRGEAEPTKAAKPEAEPAVEAQPPPRQETATRDLGADNPPRYPTRDITRK